MGKLSQEEWTIAFYAVMKETPPASPRELRRVSDTLAGQQGKAAKTLQAASGAARLAEAKAADDERKRYAAGVDLDDTRRRVIGGGPALDDAQKRYDGSVTTARDQERQAKEARSAENEASFALEQLKGQVAEIERRIKDNDLEGLSPELNEALQTARLQSRVKSHDSIIGSLEEEIAGKRTTIGTYGFSKQDNEEIQGNVDRLQETANRYKADRDVITALMAGFDIAPAKPSATKELGATAEKMKGAAQAADKGVAVRQEAVDGKQKAVAAGQKGVEAAALKDPELKKAMDDLAAKREAQVAAEGKLVDASDQAEKSDQALRKAQTVLDSYASGGAQPPSMKDVNEAMATLQTGVTELAQKKAAMRLAQDQLRKAVGDVGAAETTLEQAVEARAKAEPKNPKLEEAVSLLAAAKGDARRAEAALAQAKQEAERIHGLADEAGRRLKVAETMPEAGKAVGALNGALAGVEDQPIWDGSQALQEKLGPKKFAELQKLGNAFINQYEKLSANGATVEELQALFKDTPDLWKPPRFREEEQNWVAMKDLLNEETEDKYRKETNSKIEAINKKLEAAKGKLEKGESVAKLLATITEAGDLGEKVDSKALQAIGKALSENKELAASAEKVIGLLSGLTSVIMSPLKAGDSAQKSMESEDPVETLMLQDEFMEEIGKLVTGLTGAAKGAGGLDIGGAVIKQIAGLLPGIGVAVSAAEVMKGLVDSAARIQEAIEDSDSHSEAVQSKHRAEPAIDQFQRRDKHLAARAASATGIAAIKTVAAGMDLAVVAAPVSTGLKGVATGIGAVKSVAEVVIDRSEGETAKKLLDLAQAGDGHARSELFRFHPRYAKGILSVMASEGDAMALRVLSTHGLTEDMIKRSSPKIIKRYLMKKFGETDDPASWTSLREGLSKALASAGEKLKAIDDFFGNIADKLLAKFDSDELVQVQAALSDYAYALPGQAASTAVTSLVEVRRQREALAKSATSEQAKELAAMDEVLAGEVKQVEAITKKVLASLAKVQAVIDRIEKLPKEPLQNKASNAAKVVLREHLARVQELSIAA